MTPRQKDILYAIRTFHEEYGYSPTLTELGELLGIAAKSAVRKHLQALAHEGKIRLTAQGALEYAAERVQVQGVVVSQMRSYRSL